MHDVRMRTTIEIRDEHRAALMALAARRGQKGFSGLVAEAISSYLANTAGDEERREKAARLRGALTEDEANELTARTAGLREEWR
jgi:metal-responsive CopG/Arc/MetJ family transcriptional regulator